MGLLSGRGRCRAGALDVCALILVRAACSPGGLPAGQQNDHSRQLAVLSGNADATDGLEVSSRSLGPGLPRRAMLAMTSQSQDFLIFRWQDIEEALAAPRPAALTP